MVCIRHLWLVPEHFRHPQKKPCTHKAVAPVPPSSRPWRPLTCPLVSMVVPFWTFALRAVLPQAAFGVWLLTQPAFLSLIHAAPCISAPFLFHGRTSFHRAEVARPAPPLLSQHWPSPSNNFITGVAVLASTCDHQPRRLHGNGKGPEIKKLVQRENIDH